SKKKLGLRGTSGCWVRNVASWGYDARYPGLVISVGSSFSTRGSDGGYLSRIAISRSRVCPASRSVEAFGADPAWLVSAGSAGRCALSPEEGNARTTAVRQARNTPERADWVMRNRLLSH